MAEDKRVRTDMKWSTKLLLTAYGLLFVLTVMGEWTDAGPAPVLIAIGCAAGWWLTLWADASEVRKARRKDTSVREEKP